jgi:hypothetical protein
VLRTRRGRTQERGLLESVGSVGDDEPVGGRSLGTQDSVGKFGNLQDDGRVEGFRSDVDDLGSLDVGDVQELGNGLDQGGNADDTGSVRSSVKLTGGRPGDGPSSSEDGNVGERCIVRSRVGDVQANVGGEETRVARVRSGLQGESGSELSSTGKGEWTKKQRGWKRLWVNS